MVSALALFVSAVTAWLTFFRQGQIKMTTPTVIFFGPDGESKVDEAPAPKIYLRTLLFSTAKRGRIIENMYARLRRSESVQNFNIWVYGNDTLLRGSGIFVGEDGVVSDHHFLLPADGTTFEFKAGEYELEIYASIFGTTLQSCLFRVGLNVTPEYAEKLLQGNNGLYFDWGSDTQRYQAHVRPRRKRLFPGLMSE
jgi:hypothetical protein